MREQHRRVAVESCDQVGIVGRQIELMKVLGRGPVVRIDDDDAIGVGDPDGLDGIVQDPVELVGLQVVVRLVQQLEGHGFGSPLVALGDLLPYREKRLDVGVGLVDELIVVMKIDDDAEVVRECLINRPIDASKEARSTVKGALLSM